MQLPRICWVFVFLILLAAVSSAWGSERVEDVYKTYCWQCHGERADGMGVNIRDMSVQPRDHSDAKEMSGRSDDELFKAIKEGGQSISKSVQMPPWRGVLSDDEINLLVEYLRELCECKFGS